MEYEKEDERACRATCEMDEKKHGCVIQPHLPVGEVLDKHRIGIRIGLDAVAHKKEDDIVAKDIAGDEQNTMGGKFEMEHACAEDANDNRRGYPPAKPHEPEGSFLQLPQDDFFLVLQSFKKILVASCFRNELGHKQTSIFVVECSAC